MNHWVDLDQYIIGEFSLESSQFGYTFSPWKRFGGQIHKCLTFDGGLAKLTISQVGGATSLCITSANELPERVVEKLVEKVVYLFGLDEDLTGLEELGETDPNLRRALKALPGYRLKATPTLEEMVLSAVISQNCSREMFLKMYWRFVERFGRRTRVDGETWCAFPTTRELLAANWEELKGCVAYRAATVMSVAKSLDGDMVRRIVAGPPSEGVALLRGVKGVGEYTAWATQLYGLRRYNLIFVDRYVQKLLGKLYLGREKVSPRGIRVFAREMWGDWQGYALDVLIAYHQGGNR